MHFFACKLARVEHPSCTMQSNSSGDDYNLCFDFSRSPMLTTSSAKPQHPLRFLHDNGFKSIHERDIAGWTPLCYAVLRDDPFLVESLLEQNANPNEVTTKAKKDAQLPKGMPALFIAGTYHSNKVRQDLETPGATEKCMILWMVEIVHQLICTLSG